MKKYTLITSYRSEDLLFLTLQSKGQMTHFRFQPGQYAALSFRGQRGKRTPVRCFSMTNSVTQKDQIEFGIRISGSFTQALAKVPTGSDIYLQGPYGQFTIDPSQDKNIVMIAGGIGITPFISMIRTNTQIQSTIPMTLLYSYRTGHHIPYHDELQQLAAKNPYLRLAFFVSDTSTIPESARMLSGRITESHIHKIVEQTPSGGTYFICGPQAFMDHTESMLTAEGISESQIITESFNQSSKVTFASGLNVKTTTYSFAAALLVFSIIGISYLDLSRYVPEHTVSIKESSEKIETTGSNTTSAATSDSSPATSTTSSTSASNTGSTSSSSGSSSTSQNTNSDYQTPVTSQS
jgi:ferredoxin-NADP reductase